LAKRRRRVSGGGGLAGGARGRRRLPTISAAKTRAPCTARGTSDAARPSGPVLVVARGAGSNAEKQEDAADSLGIQQKLPFAPRYPKPTTGVTVVLCLGAS
jgi:hypothetical protein